MCITSINDNETEMKSFETAEIYVSVLIQSCITVTRCTHTLLYHLYIMLERKEQKKKKRTNRDYIFSIDPKTWWPINIVHPGLFKRNFVLSYVLITSRMMYYFLRESYGFFFYYYYYYYSRALLGYHWTPSGPYVRAVSLFLIGATLSDVCSWGVSLYYKLLQLSMILTNRAWT